MELVMTRRKKKKRKKAAYQNVGPHLLLKFPFM